MRLLAFLLLFPVWVFAQKKTEEKKETAGENIFTEGMMLFVLEDFNGALKQFETFVKLDEKSAVGFYMKSRAESATSQNIKAEQSAEKAMSLEKGNYYFQENLANTLKKNNKYKPAQAIYLDLIKMKPDHVDSYFSLLELQVNEGEANDALKTLDLAEKQFGSSEKITKAKQAILLKENKIDAALKEGSKQVAQTPDFALNQAKVLVENKRTNDAIKLLQETVNANPEFTDGLGLLAELYAIEKNTTALSELTNKVLDTKHYPYSLKVNVLGNYLKLTDKTALESLAEKTTQLTSEYSDQARGFVYLGDINYRLNQPLKARDAYRKAVKLDKNQFEVWLAIAQINYRIGDFKGLEKDAENGTMYFPNQGTLWLYTAVGQLENKKLDDAELSLEEAERLLPNDQSLIAVKSEWKFLKSGKAGEATTADNEFALYYQVKQLLNGQSDKALTLAAKLSERFPTNNTYKVLFAQALILAKKPNEALEALEFVKENDFNARYFLAKGDALSALGKADEAQIEWKKALTLDKTIQEKIK